MIHRATLGILVALTALGAALAPRAAVARPGGAALDLPGAGPVVDVAQSEFRDGFAQRIAFADGSRSFAEVSLRTGGQGSTFGPSVTISKPTRLGIAAELVARFPGEIMRVSPRPRRNAHGPVGLALGSDCLYAWQWIDLDPRRAGHAPRESLFGASTERAASIRIKLCRTATATLADLVDAVERMRLSTGPVETGGGSRISSRPGPRAHRSVPAARRSVEPAASAGNASRAPGPMERPSPPVVRSGAARRPTVEAETGRPLPAAPSPALPRADVPVPSPPAQGNTPRYITDGLPGQAPVTPVAVPKPVPNAAGSDDRLSRDLPSRAYRPPP